MKPKTRAAIDAIFNEAEAKHGETFRGAVDVLASVAAVYAHAMDHCDDLADEVRIVGYASVNRILKAAGIYALKGEVCDFANRIIEARQAGARTPDDAPPAAPFNPNLH